MEGIQNMVNEQFTDTWFSEYTDLLFRLATR